MKLEVTMKSVRHMLDVLPGETKRHCMRTAVYALTLAGALPQLKELAPNKDELFIHSAIYDGGLFHDIGKFMYSKQLLQSPKRLTETEWMIIRTHPTRAYEILMTDDDFLNADQDYKSIVANCCLYHHESYDGNGYPHKLKGEEIPLVAQIISACDVLDALSSARPYKKTLPFEQAHRILMNSVDKFSPEILCALEVCKDELNDLYRSRKMYRRAVSE